jgi:hypothetical protein
VELFAAKHGVTVPPDPVLPEPEPPAAGGDTSLDQLLDGPIEGDEGRTGQEHDAAGEAPAPAAEGEGQGSESGQLASPAADRALFSPHMATPPAYIDDEAADEADMDRDGEEEQDAGDVQAVQDDGADEGDAVTEETVQETTEEESEAAQAVRAAELRAELQAKVDALEAQLADAVAADDFEECERINSEIEEQKSQLMLL